MVRNYVRKTNRRAYSDETFEEALTEIREERINPYNASKKYKIPLSTIMDRLKGKHGIISKSLGRRTAISKEHEKQLVDILKTMENFGFEVTRNEVLELVGEFIKVNKLKTPFKDGHPGEDWFLGFKKRHNLSLNKKVGSCLFSNNIFPHFMANTTALKQCENENDEDATNTDERPSTINKSAYHPLTFINASIHRVVNPSEEATSSVEESSEILQKSLRNSLNRFEKLLLEIAKTNCKSNILTDKKVTEGAEDNNTEEIKNNSINRNSS